MEHRPRRRTAGIESTPLAVDGVLFATGPWSVVYAIDARAGKLLWTFDPQVPRRYGRIACCDVVNRGVALYEGKVFVGTLDGRLIAIDAATGAQDLGDAHGRPGIRLHHHRCAARRRGQGHHRQRRRRDAACAATCPRTIPPTGKLLWRFYTVPGDPSKPFESPALAAAAKTWNGKWWEVGGGGTAWDSMAYDPQLDLLYIGTGNGSPWARSARSQGGGDNLYLSSILALRPATGELVWHLPGDARRQLGLHRDAAHDPGRPRDRREAAQGDHAGAEERVLLRARPRRPASSSRAEPYAKQTWAKGLDARGPPDRVARGRLRREHEGGVAGADRQPQLAADGLRSEDRPRLHPDPGAARRLRARQALPVQEGLVEHGERVRREPRRTRRLERSRRRDASPPGTR